jgi:hypothetical protein
MGANRLFTAPAYVAGWGHVLEEDLVDEDETGGTVVMRRI